MPLPYLTDVEVIDIVKPLTQPAAIVRWFNDHGFYVKKRPNGMPLISRGHFEARTVAGINDEPAGYDGFAPRPDRAAFEQRYKRKVWRMPSGRHRKTNPLGLDPTKHVRLHTKHGAFYYVLRKARHFLDLLIEMEQDA